MEVLEKMGVWIINQNRERGRIKAGFKDILEKKVKEMNMYLTRVDDTHTSVKINLFMNLGLLGLATKSIEQKRFYWELGKRLEKYPLEPPRLSAGGVY